LVLRIGITLVLVVFLLGAGSAFGRLLTLWNAPTGAWFVDAAGLPVAGACEAAALLRSTAVGVERGTPNAEQLSADDARKLGDQALQARFVLSELPADPTLSLIQTMLGSRGNTSAFWLYIARLPPDPASAARLSEAAARQKAALVLIDAVTGDVLDVLGVADAAPPDSCGRDVRAIARTMVRVPSLWVAGGSAGLLVLLSGVIVIARALQRLNRRRMVE